MTASPFFKILSETPLLSVLHQSKSISHILQTHTQLITSSFSNPFITSRLLFAIAKLPVPPSAAIADYAERILSQTHHPNTFSWNTVIKIHSHASNPVRAIQFFCRMRRTGVSTDCYTYPFVLKACGSMPMPGLNVGPAVHGEVLKKGLGVDVFTTNGLISSYCRSGELVLARILFDGCRWKDLVSWNTMIAGYVNSGQMGDARDLFDEMPVRDSFSWAIVIGGYVKKAGDVCRARELFDEMLPGGDVVCWNSMIDGYAGIGQLDTAWELFERMPRKNVVSWSILMDGYVRYGDPLEALGLFWRMVSAGVMPDKFSAVSVVSACAQLGALDQGRRVHSYLKKNRVLFDVVVQTALVDMYMKCGSLGVAIKLFESMHERSVISWNAMIVGLGTNGCGDEAVELFYQMEKGGSLMDDLTFLGVLTACLHAGMVTEALEIFDRMSNLGIEPKVEHYGCLVDLLGRTGRLDEARNVIETMPVEPTPGLWGSLLAACRNHRCVELAELSVKHLMNLGADDSGMYVLMSNIYADAGLRDDVLRIRKVMHDKGMKKETGRSVVEVDGEVHEFVNADRSHYLREEIYSSLRSLFNVLAYTRYI